MNPALQQYVLMSAMNQPRQGNMSMLPPEMMGGMGAPTSGGVPGPYMGAQDQSPSPYNYKPLPMSAPRSESPLGNAAMEAGKQNEPEQQEENPITRGAENAIRASRVSYDMNPEQRRRAEGDAIMAFFGNMARSTNPSALGTANESFSPALQQFRQSEKDFMSNNKDIYREEREMRKEELARQRENRIGAGGGMSMTNQSALESKYGNALTKFNNTFQKKVNDAFYNLSADQQTPAARQYIEEQVKQRMAPDLAVLNRLKVLAAKNGLDLSYGDEYLDSDDGYGYEEPAVQQSASPYETVSDEDIDARIAQLQGGA